MTVETRYWINDFAQRHGIYSVLLENARRGSYSYTNDNEAEAYGAGQYWKTDVIIKHADESETTVGSAVASVYRSGYSQGMGSATWACPETQTATDDDIEILEKIDGFYPWTTGFIADISATQLDASTWTFYKYTYIGQAGGSGDTNYRFYYGSTTYDSRIEGFSYSGGGGGGGGILQPYYFIEES